MNAHWFLTLADAREKMEDWLTYYNEVRPHGAIGNKPPISLQKSGSAPTSCREAGRKLQPPAVQQMGPDQSGPDSNSAWRKSQWQVTGPLQTKP